MDKNKERYLWIDVLKGLAILAVLVDHHALPFAKFSIYSVSTFFIILGFNSFNSILRSGDCSIRSRAIHCKTFITFYVICSCIYLADSGKFSLANIYESILFFNSSSPLYFCAIYIQISLFSAFLYRIVASLNEMKFTKTRHKIFCFLSVFAFMWFASLALRSFIIFPDLHGGGKYLLGSTYLFLTFSGMVIANMFEDIKLYKKIFIILSIFVIVLSPLYIKSAWSNPPYFITCIYTVAIFFFVSLTGLFERGRITKILALIGKFSVHIFMYHLIVMKHASIFNSHTISFCISIIFPIFFGAILDKIILRKPIFLSLKF